MRFGQKSKLNNGITRHPGASTLGNKLINKDQFPWLTNPGNTAMSSHMGEKERRHVELINSGKKEGEKPKRRTPSLRENAKAGETLT